MAPRSSRSAPPANGRPVTRDHIVFAVDQNRNIEAESPDAVGDLSDLLLGMPARVGGVRFQLVDATIDDVQTQTAPRVSFSNIWLEFKFVQH